jgi:hypothetical protein
VPIADVVRLLPEYVFFWGRFWLGSPITVPRVVWFQLKRFIKGFRWVGKARRS